MLAPPEQGADRQEPSVPARKVDNTPPAPDEPQYNEDSVDWASLYGGDDDGGESAITEPPAQPQQPPQQQEGHEPQAPEPTQQQQPQEPAPQAEQPPAQEPPAQPQATPEAQPATPPAEAPQAAQPEQAQPQPEQPQVDMEAIRAEARKQLREAYTLTEEQANAFETDGPGTLAQLAAEMHIRVYDAIYAGILSQLPYLVGHVMQQRENEQRFSEDFFNKWPKLRGHEAVVNRLMGLYKQAYPNASAEQQINDVGIQAMVSQRLQFDNAPAPTQQPAAASPQPPQQPAQNFRPATPGGSAPPAPAPASGDDNVFSNMAEEFLQED